MTKVEPALVQWDSCVSVETSFLEQKKTSKSVDNSSQEEETKILLVDY